IGAAAFVSFGLNTLGTKKITNPQGNIVNGEGADPALFRPMNEVDARRGNFYYIANSATAYYWRDLGFMLNGLRLHAGIGYLKVIEATRQNEFDFPDRTIWNYDSVSVVGDESVLDLFVRLSYDHDGKTTYGVALQYFNGGMMGEVYLNIFSWLRAEVKYSRMIFRDPEIWENNEMIVPGLRFGFAF
ncbi:MAG: hypothetical protein KFH87_08245, partial [Bacteroidetes bacterium]|nr:hypothetical protein [Bacteroidota bacterium]